MVQSIFLHLRKLDPCPYAPVERLNSLHSLSISRQSPKILEVSVIVPRLDNNPVYVVTLSNNHRLWPLILTDRHKVSQCLLSNETMALHNVRPCSSAQCDACPHCLWPGPGSASRTRLASLSVFRSNYRICVIPAPGPHQHFHGRQIQLRG